MKALTPLQNRLQQMNEALVLGSLRQHELTEASEKLNAQLHQEMGRRKIAEIALRRSEKLFHGLFHSIDEGFCILEKISGPDSDYRYLEINPAFKTQSGMEDVTGKTIREILSHEADGWIAIYDQVLLTGEAKRFERTLLTLNRSLELFVFRVEDSKHRSLGVLFIDRTRHNFEQEIKNRITVLQASNHKLELEITRRKALETELLTRERTEKGLRIRTRQLAHQVLHSQEQERLRISRELHDQVVQTLIAINTRLVGLQMQAAHPGPDFKQQLSLAQALVEKSVETVHELSRDLRPDLLDILGFIPSLRELLKGFLKDTGVRASLTVFSGIEKLNETIRTALYRVIQEALSNVARHAQASLVEIRIQKEGAFVVMEIVDNGKGFSRLSTPKSPKKSRLGLIGMQERIEMLDGTFKVEGRAGNGMGTTVTAKVPYK